MKDEQLILLLRHLASAQAGQQVILEALATILALQIGQDRQKILLGMQSELAKLLPMKEAEMKRLFAEISGRPAPGAPGPSRN